MSAEKEKRITEKELRRLQERSVEMLEAIRHPAAAERLKRAVKGVLGRLGANETEPLFWPAGFLLLGIAESAAVLPGSDSAVRAARQCFSDWLDKGGRINYADDALAGAAALRLLRGNGTDSKETVENTRPVAASGTEKEAAALREAASRIFQFLREAPRDTAGSIIYHPSETNRCVYADGTGMVAVFLSAYAAFHDPVTGEPLPGAGQAKDMARVQLANYLRYGTDTHSGLPYHGYQLRADGTAEKKGLIGWGRATGFLMMGFAAYLSRFADEELQAQSAAFTEKVLACQRPDGLFSWQLGAREGHVDTSASAMIGWALTKDGAVPDQQARVDALGAGLLSYLTDGRLTDSLAECVDFGEHPQRYGTYPWGMGAALLFFSSPGA